MEVVAPPRRWLHLYRMPHAHIIVTRHPGMQVAGNPQALIPPCACGTR
jgi:hypothetical protein